MQGMVPIKPTGKQIDEAADIWSFIMNNLGLDFKENITSISR
jgi:hypothetical protein